jgi:TolB protein
VRRSNTYRIRPRGAGREDWIEANIANTDIYLINSNGTGTIRLTWEAGADINQSCMVAGRPQNRIASDRDGNREMNVMNADGTEPARLTNQVARDYRPAYSPDGKPIAFVSERDGNAEIYVMDVDGTNVSRFTTNPGQDMDPAWSPDGSRIAFRGNGSLYVMNASGQLD